MNLRPCCCSYKAALANTRTRLLRIDGELRGTVLATLKDCLLDVKRSDYSGLLGQTQSLGKQSLDVCELLCSQFASIDPEIKKAMEIAQWRLDDISETEEDGPKTGVDDHYEATARVNEKPDGP